MKYLNLELEKLEFPITGWLEWINSYSRIITLVDCGVMDLVVDLNGESGGSLSIFRRIHINHIVWLGDVGDKIFINILLTYFVSHIDVARFSYNFESKS